MWRLTAPVKSHKVQLEARHSSKHSDFEQNFEGKQALSKVLSKEKEACSKVLSKEKEACLSSDFEYSVASKHARAGISSAQWPRMKKKHA